MKKKFIGYVTGYICTNDIDSHGDKLTPETIEDIKDQIERDSSLRTMFLQHDESQPCGEMLEFRVDTKGEWKGLWAKIGVYKNRKDIWEMIKNRRLTGFSIGARVLEEQRLEVCNEEDLVYKFDLEVDSRLKSEVKDLLDKEGLKSEVYIQKALDVPTIITVAASGLFIIDRLYEYHKRLKKKKQKKQRDVTVNYFNIVIGEQRFNFNQNSLDEIKKHLEDFSQLRNTMPDEIKKRRIRAHQFIITEKGYPYQDALCKANDLFKEIGDEIHNMDEKSWKWIPRMLKIAKDAGEKFKRDFEELEQLYQTKNLLTDRIPLSLAKDKTLKLFAMFESRLQDWLELGSKEEGVDLAKKFRDCARQIKYLQDVLRNEKIGIFEEFEKSPE